MSAALVSTAGDYLRHPQQGSLYIYSNNTLMSACSSQNTCACAASPYCRKKHRDDVMVSSMDFYLRNAQPALQGSFMLRVYLQPHAIQNLRQLQHLRITAG